MKSTKLDIRITQSFLISKVAVCSPLEWGRTPKCLENVSWNGAS